MKGAKVRDSCRSSSAALVGQPVPLQVVDQALRPVVAAPDAQALLVVVGALEDLRAGQRLHVLAAAGVVGVEVGDHDPRDLDAARAPRAQRASASGSPSPVSTSVQPSGPGSR